MGKLPETYNDLKNVLGESGFKTPDNGVWYHGTSSALVERIKSEGLKRSGDQAINQAAKQTMATIGNNYSERREPVFLTQSKALAYFWAEQCVRRRAVRFEGNERPVVIGLQLDDSLNNKVRPDVGAAGLLMIKEGEAYMAHLALCYEDVSAGVLDIDLAKAERGEYLSKLGMAYIDQDLPVSAIVEYI